MNLARHHRLPRAGPLQEAEHPPELAHAHPLDLIHQVRQLRLGLVMKRRRHDARHTGRARRARHGKRVRAVAGDDGEGARELHAGSMAKGAPT